MGRPEMPSVVPDNLAPSSDANSTKRSAGVIIWGYVALLVVLLALIGFVHYRLDPNLKPLVIKEGGIIETASAIGHFAAALAMLILGGWQAVKRNWSLFLLLLAFGSRELDFDKRFTSEKIFNLRMYTGDEAPLTEQLIGLSIIALLLFAVFTAYKRYGAAFKTGLRQLQFVPVSVTVALVLMVISKGCDGLARKLAGVGINISREANSLASDVEEVFELAVACIFLLCVVKAFRPKKRGLPDHNVGAP